MILLSAPTPVIPAEAGIPLLLSASQGSGIPAFAGMTGERGAPPRSAGSAGA